MKFNHTFAPLALGCLLAGVPAQATSFTYTYQGNDFSVADVVIPGNIIGTSIITTSDAISGSFTVNLPLAANLNNQVLLPRSGPDLMSVSFTDGAGDTEPVNLNDSFVVVSTDSKGNITSWKIDVYSVTGATTFLTCSSTNDLTCGYRPVSGDEPEYSQDFAVIFSTVDGIDAVNDGFTFNDPGTWTRSVAWTPEPSSFWLLGTGVLLLGGFAVRRNARFRSKQN